MASASPPRNTRVGWLVGGLIAMVACLAYRNSFRGEFIFDDLASIPENASIRHFASILNPPWSAGETVGGRPVLNATLALNYAVSGNEVWSYHALNLLIHLASGCLVFGLAWRIFRTAGLAAWSQLAGAAVALIWTAHPLETEAVTYVVQRAESLMSFCYLLTLYAFTRGCEREGEKGGGRGWFTLSVIACLLGMGSKEVMASAPVIVFFYDRCFVAGSVREAWRRHRLQHGMLAATWILLGFLVLHTGGNRGGSSGFDVGVSWGGYLLTQFPAIAHYLRMVVWPSPLVFEYELVWIPLRDALPTLVVVIALVAASVGGLIRNSVWGFLGIWFFALLAPSSLIPGGGQAIVEHRMYLALFPVLASLAFGLFRSLKPTGPVRWIAIVGLALLVGVEVQGTVHRNEDYRSRRSIWADTVDKVPEQPIACYNYGRALMDVGDDANAEKFYRRALAHRPQFGEAHEGLAFVLARNSKPEEAQKEYLAAITAKPHYPDAEFNLGNLYVSQRRFGEAANAYEQAIRDRPRFAVAELNFANTLLILGRVEESVPHYRNAIAWDPASSDAHHNLGIAWQKLGRADEAAAEFQAAARLGAGR